jgi:Ribosomal protein L7/L12 C-terminal domain
MATSSQLLPDAAVSALHQGQKIQAIRIVRTENSLGLREAKDLVDAYIAGTPELDAKFPARSGMPGWVFFLVIGMVVAITLFILSHRG